MWSVFKTDKTSGFKIDNYVYGRPLNIIHNNLYLSSATEKNVVDFYFTDDNKGKQKWIMEESADNDSTVHIGATQPNKYGEKYLGAPNSDNTVFMYTSKTKHTKWKITKAENNTYNIVYVGEKFNLTTHTIVVARYNENLEWLIPYNDCAVVYNKGENSIPQFKNVINLPNIGREGNTYLRYIIDNYDNFPSQITFIQGDPFGHNKTILFGLDNYNNFPKFQPLGIRWLDSENIPPLDIVEKFKKQTAYGLEYLTVQISDNLDYLNDYTFIDEGINKLKVEFWSCYGKKESIVDWFIKRAEFQNRINKSTKSIEFTFSGLFSTSRINIMLHPVNFYNKLSNVLIERNIQSGINGVILERLWMFFLDNSK